MTSKSRIRLAGSKKSAWMISKIIEAQVLLSDIIVSILVPQLLKIFD